MGKDIAMTKSQHTEKSGPEKSETSHDHGHHHRKLFGISLEMIFTVTCGALLGVGWGLERFTNLSEAIPLALYLFAYVFGGFYAVSEAVEKVRGGRFEIDFLMLVAAVGAASLGEWAEGALLLFLFSLGHALENYAMGRAKRAIEALAELAPETARVRRDDQTVDVPVEELEVGDTIVVRPDERLPADGFIIKGESGVDQSPVTGESIPVDKRPVDEPDAVQDPDALDAAHRVFAGTINGSGVLEIRVTRRSDENTLARVVKMVTEAQAQQSPTQRFTDKFQRIFVPAVLIFVVLLFFAPFVLDEPFSVSFYRAMAVLVAASPCALAISTPSAVLSGVARAGRSGVLVKGGAPLENLGQLSAIAFDKTGTITKGEPRLTDVKTHDGADEDNLLCIAAAVEDLSGHPLAKAVVRDASERLGGGTLPEASSLESITGRGIRAQVQGQSVYVGKDDLFGEVDAPALPESIRVTVEQLERDGRTTMIVLHGDRYLGVLGLMDTPRESASAVIKSLRGMGIRRTIMISGDNQRVVDAVASEVGIDDAWGDLMPEDKVQSIKKLCEQEGLVAMVGDGVNDAPAMANATVGIAMGAAGSDVALETADVALMADDLNLLPFAVGLSRKTRGIIRQNLWISLGMVAFLVPATVLGLGIGPAVALHEGSTLIVVFNALRVLAFKTESQSEDDPSLH
jgi:Cd2+/Zn2+-exporting ATPase